jgi:D-tyrosyl-tRNA(Tyr) deacylase
MRAVVQTVSRASVTIAGQTVATIDPGLLVLVGVTHADTTEVAAALAAKVYHLRIFPAPVDPVGDAPASGRGQEQSAGDLALPLLVVSQFTLYGDARKGRRPSWAAAAPAHVAEPLIDAFVAALRELGARVATGRFQAWMQVESVNVGPHTILLEL